MTLTAERQVVSLDSARDKVEAENARLGRQGLRVMTVARRDFDPGAFDPSADVPFVVPKALLPLDGRPVVQHIVEELFAVGISRVWLVTRPGQAIEEQFAGDARVGVVHQPEPADRIGEEPRF